MGCGSAETLNWHQVSEFPWLACLDGVWTQVIPVPGTGYGHGVLAPAMKTLAVESDQQLVGRMWRHPQSE